MRVEKSYFNTKLTSRLLALLVLIFVLQRGSVMLCGYRAIAHPAFDETASGVLACDLLDGQLRAPLFAYQYEARSGDGLIEGALLVPFFKLFGRSLFSLKGCALFSSLITLMCWIVLLKRYQGIWAAIAFAGLFALPPPTFTRLGLMGTIASHHIINPLAALQLLFLFRVVEGERSMVGAWWWLGFGFLSGLGTYAFYTFLIFSSFCLLFLLVGVPSRITLKGSLWYAGGFTVGVSPWVFRSLSSPAGGHYLAVLLKNMGIDRWSFMQNFFFNLPHSFGYGYPSRDIGIVSVLFVLFLVGCGGIILKGFFYSVRSAHTGSMKNGVKTLSLSHLQGLCFVCFPLFFLLCFSLSPMKILPFEYWPSVGFFGYFSVADVYRYRWLHLLFPFYFAICAVGTSTMFTRGGERSISRLVVILGFVFFLGWGAAGSFSLCSLQDFNRLRCYKGYSYDQMGNRFLLSDSNYYTLHESAQFIQNYPQENWGEVYRCLGTTIALRALHNAHSGEGLEQWLMGVPPPYLNDGIYGIVRAAQDVAEEEFTSVGDMVAKMHPRAFYTQWGFRHLGYKYYSLLLNREKVFASIPPVEKWFFKRFLSRFDQQLRVYHSDHGRENLLRDLGKVPDEYQPEVVRGIGMLVGAEMCFDPLLTPDYPLDSRSGEQFNSGLREAFYEGVGSGCAETLCRFWRTLLLPADATSPLYEKMLDIEWERFHSLRSRLPSPYAGFVERGFWTKLREALLDSDMQKYLRKKGKKRGMSTSL
jgi:hypothetical protein